MMDQRYLFAAINHPDESGSCSVVVVSEGTWKQEGHLDEFVDEEIKELFQEYELCGLCPGFFEYTGYEMDKDDIKKVLMSEGLFYSKALEDWFNDLDWD